ncbi:MAG: hypothetical protein ACJ8F7_19655 [Gemmataceae bacterium]
MTLYNVHIYREMRLHFPGVEANTPEEAARIAADQPTADAAYTEDCDGETLAALIDVVGDDEFGQSVSLDFDKERLRKAAPNLLATLEALLAAADDLGAAIDDTTDQFDDERTGLDGASRLARTAIATARTGNGATD